MAEHPVQMNTSPYAYAGNNPISRIDADGNCWPCWVIRGLAIVAEGAATSEVIAAGGAMIGTAIVMNSLNQFSKNNDYSVQDGISGPKIILKPIAKVESTEPGSNKDNEPKIKIDDKDKVDREKLDAPSKHGNAPTFKKDGTSVEIHHDGQKAEGPFKEMHKDDHRTGENYKKNHPQGQKPLTKDERKQFKKDKKEDWENEYPKS